MENIPQVIGWVGTVLIITAYFLVSLKRIDVSSKLYQLMNLFGALGVGINVFIQQAWPALTLQVIWGVIAVFSLAKMRKNQ